MYAPPLWLIRCPCLRPVERSRWASGAGREERRARRYRGDPGRPLRV